MNNNIRNITLLILFLLYVNISQGQSCLPDGITFNSQVQIDSFSYNYPGCKEIEGDVIITGGDVSNLQGLNGITKMDSFLGILNADSLITLQGLNNLCEIEGQLWIGYFGPDGNMSLESVSGLERLKYIGQGLTVIQNPKLENFIGFDSLSYVSNLLIGSNTSLNSLDGFYSLDTIDYELVIAGTENLTDLNGLSNLSYINHLLTIKHNDMLSDISGLENLNENSVNWNLSIYDNPYLSQCAISPICDLLADSITSVIISNNNFPCNSPEEVIQECLASISDSEPITDDISIFPNPSDKKISINTQYKTRLTEINIFDTYGNLVIENKTGSTEIDISALSSGIYIVELRTNESIVRQKIIKK